MRRARRRITYYRNSNALLYDNAIKAFDRLVVDYGYSVERLVSANREIRKLGISDRARWTFSIALLAAYKKNVKPRPRNPFVVLASIYTPQEITEVANGNKSWQKIAVKQP